MAEVVDLDARLIGRGRFGDLDHQVVCNVDGTCQPPALRIGLLGEVAGLLPRRPAGNHLDLAFAAGHIARAGRIDGYAQVLGDVEKGAACRGSRLDVLAACDIELDVDVAAFLDGSGSRGRIPGLPGGCVIVIQQNIVRPGTVEIS